MAATAPRRRTTGSLAVNPAERRRHRRVALPAVASVVAGGKHLGIFTVADLSAGGALLIGDALAVPGQRVEMDLQLPGRPKLPLMAKVLRRQVGPVRGKKCGVRFEFASPAEAETVAEMIAAPRPSSEAQVLLVWNRPSSAGALPRDLGNHGMAPLVVSTPLEAAAWLCASGPRLQCVLVDYLLAGSNGWDFMQYLRESHPAAKRILLCDGIGNFRLNLLLSSGLADAVLEKPWSAAALMKKLGR